MLRITAWPKRSVHHSREKQISLTNCCGCFRHLQWWSDSLVIVSVQACDKLVSNWSILRLGKGPSPGPEPEGATAEDEIPLCKLTFTGENDLFLPHLLHRTALVDLLLCKVCISVTVQLSDRLGMCHDLQQAAILKVPLSVHCNVVEACL